RAWILDLAGNHQGLRALHLGTDALGKVVVSGHYSYSLKSRTPEAEEASIRVAANRLPGYQHQARVRLQCAGHLDLLEDLDLVADRDVVVALHANAALHAGTHFGHVVLEAAQRFQLALEDHHVLAQHTDRTVAVHHALDHHAAGHRAELRRAEHVTHL